MMNPILNAGETVVYCSETLLGKCMYGDDLAGNVKEMLK